MSSFAFSQLPVEINNPLGKVFDPKAASVPAAVRASLLRMSLIERLSLAAVSIALLWAAVLWAMNLV